MSINTIKKLVENKLKTLSPSLPIAFPNVTFTPPADGSKYLRCNLNINTPDDTILGDSYYREDCTFNVYVLDKLNIGSGSAYTTAEAIRDLFAKRTTLQEGNVKIQVLRTPRIAGEIVTQDRLVVPIAIELTVEIF